MAVRGCEADGHGYIARAVSAGAAAVVCEEASLVPDDLPCAILPDTRKAAGKPRHGTVTLNAFHRGNSIVVQVADDGKGMNVDRIRETAIARGVVAAADAECMTNRQLFQLVWQPG